MIELSIVLIIVGLIIGGVLVGSEMIANAASRSQIAQIDRYNSAVEAFRTKYNCLPGDCPNATAYGFYNATTGFGANGNGDGYVNQASNGTQFVNQNAEEINFWYHLNAAGMSDYSASATSMPTGNVNFTVQNMLTTMPPSKINNNTYVVATNFYQSNAAANNWMISAGNGYFIGAPYSASGPSGQAYFTSALTPDQAYGIDSKMDDGLPYSGKVVRGAELSGAFACANSSCGCVDAGCMWEPGSGSGTVTVNGAVQYNVANKTQRFNLAFINQF